jgi:aromatic-L-amino-acid decarboxylase
VIEDKKPQPDIQWGRLGASLNEFRRTIRQLPVVRQVQQQEVVSELKRYDFRHPIPLDELTDDVIRLFRTHSLHVTHPRYFGLFNPGVREAGIVAETLAATFNPQLAAWSHSPIANEIEQHVLQVFAGLLGFSAGATTANFTTGGAEANLTALLAALSHNFPGWSEGGVAAFEVRPRIYLSADGHDSFLKAARVCGLGTAAVRRLPTRRPTFAMDPGELGNLIADDRKDGWFPLMIVGTAGTTSTGAVDPLEPLARLANEHKAWFHVDAAWGGTACLSPKLRKHISGIELADSVTWDAHKWLWVPFSAGMFFCRHVDAVHSAFSVQASYMPGPTAKTIDPYANTIQWSRRAIGLKVFMSLAELGLSGYCQLIEHQASMGDFLRRHLKDEGYEVVNDTALPLTCFTHPVISEGKRSTSNVLADIYARGRVWISDVAPGGEARVLRACVTHYETNQDDIECLLEELRKSIAVV